MRLFVGTVGILGLLAGAALFASARSAVHEIEALIAILIGVTGLGCAGIMEHLARVNADSKALVAYAKMQHIEHEQDRLGADAPQQT